MHLVHLGCLHRQAEVVENYPECQTLVCLGVHGVQAELEACVGDIVKLGYA